MATPSPTTADDVPPSAESADTFQSAVQQELEPTVTDEATPGISFQTTDSSSNSNVAFTPEKGSSKCWKDEKSKGKCLAWESKTYANAVVTRANGGDPCRLWRNPSRLQYYSDETLPGFLWQHRCVASTLSRQNSESLLTQRLNLSLQDGLKGTNSAYNDGATGNSLNLRLRKIGIRYTAKNGRTEDQVLYFAVASFLMQGSQIPWSEGRAGTKEEDELADLLGVDPVTVQLSDNDSIICDSDEEPSSFSNNGCEDLLGATANGISRIIREGKELIDSMHVDTQERVSKRGHQEISRDFSSLTTAAAGRDHGFASILEEYDNDLN
ncbi:hypothetical protein IV203_032443 [Nitzschia inconspicua]|uniref:Uncharacterized protein n=1 Tax=Nitzschia inconspicua TaxID=303405 RepID=A0A9K3KJI7_9STRA|nr:hypothetical protein IV203_032443 [Nitzschia inconspicua]